MRRAIQKYIEDPVSLLMIDGTVPDGSDVMVTVKGKDELDFTIKTHNTGESRVPAGSSAE